MVAVGLVGAACASSSPTQQPVGGASATPAATRTPCATAPAWLVAAVQGGIETPGARLTHAFVLPAGTIQDGPPIVLGSKFADAQLVVGVITGGGVLDERAVWITNATSADDPGLIFAVSAAAKRYSSWGADVTQDIVVERFGDALICAS
jgi:hypothetical protein